MAYHNQSGSPWHYDGRYHLLTPKSYYVGRTRHPLIVIATATIEASLAHEKTQILQTKRLVFFTSTSLKAQTTDIQIIYLSSFS